MYAVYTSFMHNIMMANDFCGHQFYKKLSTYFWLIYIKHRWHLICTDSNGWTPIKNRKQISACNWIRLPNTSSQLTREQVAISVVGFISFKKLNHFTFKLNISLMLFMICFYIISNINFSIFIFPVNERSSRALHVHIQSSFERDMKVACPIPLHTSYCGPFMS